MDLWTLCKDYENYENGYFTLLRNKKGLNRNTKPLVDKTVSPQVFHSQWQLFTIIIMNNCMQSRTSACTGWHDDVASLKVRWMMLGVIQPTRELTLNYTYKKQHQKEGELCS